MEALGAIVVGLLLLAGPAAGQRATGTSDTRGTSDASTDLSAQFPDAATRAQGKTGACHIFTSVSLLEAAYFRQYASHFPLSEADLFVRKVLKDPRYFSQVEAAVQKSTGAALAYRFLEGGSPADDIDFALQEGLAKAATAPWPAFAKRYYAFRDTQDAAIAAKKDKRFDATVAAPVEMGREQAADARDGRLDQMRGPRTAPLARAKVQADQQAGAAKDSFIDFLREAQGKTQAEAETSLLGDDPQLAKDRAFVKSETAGFKVVKQYFSGLRTPLGTGCLLAGAPVRAALLQQLRKGIPVSVGMDLGGLQEWGDYPPSSFHAFTVVGFHPAPGGFVSFDSRNSWGGTNPEIPEHHLCRVDSVVYVLTREEQKP